MKLVTLLLLATLALAGCKAVPAPPTGGALNAEDGKHYVSAIGKWKYSAKVAPSPKFPQCKWEVWGLQKDGWKQLYKGHGVGKVQLPPDGVYGSAYLKSTACGSWHGAK